MNLVIQTGQEIWQLQTAKAQFSEVFRRARSMGPQYITRRGAEAVVMVAAEEYEALVGRAAQPESLVRFFRESPLADVDWEFERDADTGRDVEL